MTNRGLWWAGLLIAAAGVVGFAVYIAIGHDHCPEYSYINQDFACDPAVSHEWYVKLESALEEYAAGTASRGVTELAVYYRDLRDGVSVGVGATRDFAPASLLKLPVVVAILSMAERDPALLTTTIPYDKAALDARFDIPDSINFDMTGNTLKDGGSYPVQDLLRASLVYSDNYAYFALLQFINLEYPGGTAEVGRALQELGIIDPRTPSEETVTVRNYSGIFRILYNTAFLSADNSELVLHWLVEATFHEGLIAGVPASIPVATKFGERVFDDSAKQLHDCGIVFYPQAPYTLCVMTKGAEWSTLKDTIATVSRTVYEAVDARYR